MEGDTEDSGGVGRELDKLLITEYLGSAIDVDRVEELVKQARKTAAKKKLDMTNAAENMVNEKEQMDEGEMM
jgi:hypothetical protein